MPFVMAHAILSNGFAYMRRHSFVAAYYYCYRVRVLRVHLRWLMPLLLALLDDLEAFPKGAYYFQSVNTLAR